tara:strand:+ start:572 stop:1087 length:516 start_codon:yes stop_codon:yes gene_type:complete
MKKISILTLLIICISCQNNQMGDKSDWAGVTTQNDEKTKIVEKLAKGYEQGKFEIAREYFSPDGKHMVNLESYTVDEIIEGYNFHSVLYDDLEHIDPVVHTTVYNNDSVFTNQWANWRGVSKITGEESKLTFHCWWKWEGDKIVQTQCYFETADLLKEAALYAESQNSISE